MRIASTAAMALALFSLTAPSHADEAAIRKSLRERVPQLANTIDEIQKAPVPGLFEVRVGTDILYTDSEGRFIIQGTIIDTKVHRNLTEERTQKLLAISFDKLPLKDAFTIVRGNGSRKLAIFEDPNCGYCKRFEQDLQKIDNVTVYLFLYPILGDDSHVKARTLWCAKDRGRSWQDWMLKGQLPVSSQCDTTALDRNVEFGRKYKINATPTTLLADGQRAAGAMSGEQMEKLLAGSRN